MGTLKKLFLVFLLATGASIAFTVAQVFIFDPSMLTPWSMVGSTVGGVTAVLTIVIWGILDTIPWIQDRYWLCRSARRLKGWENLKPDPDPMEKWRRVR